MKEHTVEDCKSEAKKKIAEAGSITAAAKMVGTNPSSLRNMAQGTTRLLRGSMVKALFGECDTPIDKHDPVEVYHYMIGRFGSIHKAARGARIGFEPLRNLKRGSMPEYSLKWKLAKIMGLAGDEETKDNEWEVSPALVMRLTSAKNTHSYYDNR